MKAIIGGTGIDNSEYFRKHAKIVSTPFGDVEYMEKDGIILLPRHSKATLSLPIGSTIWLTLKPY